VKAHKAPAAAKKVSSAAVPAKEVKAAEAAKKPRGKPRKTPLTDITGDINAPPLMTAPVTPAPTPLTAAPVLTALVSSITNNNSTCVRQAAAAEKAAAEKAEAGARAAQATTGPRER
jgi:hypothetical protein